MEKLKQHTLKEKHFNFKYFRRVFPFCVPCLCTENFTVLEYFIKYFAILLYLVESFQLLSYTVHIYLPTLMQAYYIPFIFLLLYIFFVCLLIE